MRYYLIIPAFLLLFTISGCKSIMDIPFCDGQNFYFTRIMVDVEDPKSEMDLFLDKNTKLMTCDIETISLKSDEFDERFNKYNITPYEFKISCDLANFTKTFYFKNHSIYSLDEGIGPCTSDNVHFLEKENLSQEYIQRFEYDLIDSRKGDFNLCIALSKEDNETYPLNRCLFEYADKLSWNNTIQALDVCDQIKVGGDNYRSSTGIRSLISVCYDNAIDRYYSWTERNGSYDAGPEIREQAYQFCIRWQQKHAEYVPRFCFYEFNMTS